MPICRPQLGPLSTGPDRRTAESEAMVNPTRLVPSESREAEPSTYRVWVVKRSVFKVWCRSADLVKCHQAVMRFAIIRQRQQGKRVKDIAAFHCDIWHVQKAGVIP